MRAAAWFLLRISVRSISHLGRMLPFLGVGLRSAIYRVGRANLPFSSM